MKVLIQRFKEEQQWKIKGTEGSEFKMLQSNIDQARARSKLKTENYLALTKIM